jgi:thiamine biosynthesis lipoprotein
MATWELDAIGTRWRITTRDPLAPSVADAVLARIEDFDRTWSRFRADSLVTEISRGAGTWTLPAEGDVLLALYGELEEATAGAVNPLVGRALCDLGYDADYSLVPSGTPAPVPSWSAVEWNPPELRTTGPVLLDVGAAGKGLLVDLVAAELGPRVGPVTVDASGDLLHRGDSMLRVALEHPYDSSLAIGVAELAPGLALCASATNRRAWGDGLHHVLDGRTGRPTHDVVATWVVADTCLLADGLATAHFLAAPEVLVGRFAHEFVRMDADGRVSWSTDFPGEVFA